MEGRAPNAETIERWVRIEGPHYVDEADRYDAMLAGFTEALMDAAALAPGERVIDVGCGNGATTLEAVERIRPGGRAMGVDVSAPMLEVARSRAEAAGARDVEFLQADAQVHDFGTASFDAVISRNGLMFFDDPDAAFSNLARALRPAGRLTFVAPQGLDRAAWIMVAGIAAAPHIGIPEGLAPDTPGPYGLADPDRTRDILTRAGFDDIDLVAVTRPMCIGADIDDAVRFLRSMPIVDALFANASPEAQAAATEAVRDALVPYAGPEGVVMDENGEWLVSAQRGA